MNTINAGVALVALTWAVQAQSQQQPPTQAAADLPGVPTPAASTIEQDPGFAQDQAPVPQAATADEGGEIVVTAQRRSERLVDVPATVTVVSEERIALAGQNSLQSLNKLVPGLYINQPIFFLSPTIRGVGSTLSVTNESAVAVYVDGVYQPAQASNVFDLASISAVEVLKGPQGTLFGRNATGGALLVTTLNPSSQPEARFNLSYGRFDEIRANGYVNLPITDGVAANLAISNRYSSGYIRDVRTGAIRNEGRSFLARGKLLVRPSANLDIVLTASRAYQNDPSGANYQSRDGINRLSATPGAGPLARGRYQVSHSVLDAIRNTANEYTAHVDLSTNLGTLSSITALKRDELRSRTDSDNTYLNAGDVDQVFKQRTFTQEVNFTSKPGGDLQYVTGAFYYHNQRIYPQFKVLGFPFLYQDNVNDAIAAYVDGSYSFGDLTLIAGVRYSTEKRKLDNALFAPLASASTASVRARDNAWTPRVGLRYALGDTSNLYATYSRGFKSGAFNGTSATGAGINPEKIDAVEVGYKLSTPPVSPEPCVILLRLQRYSGQYASGRQRDLHNGSGKRCQGTRLWCRSRSHLPAL